MLLGTAEASLGINPEYKPRHPDSFSKPFNTSVAETADSLHCSLVLTTSNGFVATVDMMPASVPESP